MIYFMAMILTPYDSRQEHLPNSYYQSLVSYGIMHVVGLYVVSDSQTLTNADASLVKVYANLVLLVISSSVIEARDSARKQFLYEG